MTVRPRKAPAGKKGNELRQISIEVRKDWHLGCIPPRPDCGVELELFRSGIAEILSLRLRVAYTPLLQGLQRIEDRVAILTTIREDPYAPPRVPAYYEDGKR